MGLNIKEIAKKITDDELVELIARVALNTSSETLKCMVSDKGFDEETRESCKENLKEPAQLAESAHLWLEDFLEELECGEHLQTLASEYVSTGL